MLFTTRSKRSPTVAASPNEAKVNTQSTVQPQDGPAAPTDSQVESLLEFATSEGLRPRIDAIRGVLHGVKVLGLTSRNGRQYREACVAAAAPLYEGIKVNVNHARGPRRTPRDYQDRLGCLRAVRTAEDGLFADLHFNPRHCLAEQLIWDAEHAPENVGLSHNVEARTSRGGNQLIVEEILRVNCVDLVADPATTAGLFESRELATPQTFDWQQMEHVLEELRRRRPELFGLKTPQLTNAIPMDHEMPTEMQSAEFAQLLEGLDPELADALRRERIAWSRELRASGKPRSKPPSSEVPRATPDARSWVRRIT